jgi:hypothetical protein
MIQYYWWHLLQKAKQINSGSIRTLLDSAYRSRAMLRFSGRNIDGKIGRFFRVRKFPFRYVKLSMDEHIKLSPFTSLRMAFHLETQDYVMETTVLFSVGRAVYVAFPKEISLQERRRTRRFGVSKGRLGFRPIEVDWDDKVESGRDGNIEAQVVNISVDGLGIRYESVSRGFCPIVGYKINNVMFRLDGEPIVVEGAFEIRDVLVEESKTLRRDGTRRRSCRLGLKAFIPDEEELAKFQQLIVKTKPKDPVEKLLRE